MADPDSPDARRPAADRLTKVSPLVWAALGAVLVLLFILAMALFGHPAAS
jgi:hypothetical protein